MYSSYVHVQEEKVHEQEGTVTFMHEKRDQVGMDLAAKKYEAKLESCIYNKHACNIMILTPQCNSLYIV